MAELKVLITREQIAQRVAEMGADINRDYAGQSIILLGVLKGAAIFLSDLSRQFKVDATFDFIGVSSYGNRPSPAQELKSGGDSTGEVRLTKDMDQSMIGKNVILVEDILDTGLTMTYLKKMLMRASRNPSGSPPCWTNPRAGNSRSRPITWVSAFPTSSWSARAGLRREVSKSPRYLCRASGSMSRRGASPVRKYFPVDKFGSRWRREVIFAVDRLLS